MVYVMGIMLLWTKSMLSAVAETNVSPSYTCQILNWDKNYH